MTEALRYVLSAEDRASAVFRRLRGEIDGIKSSTATLRGIIGPLGPQLAGAFTVAAVGSWVNRVVEGVDALNDMKDATGDSVENLSALEDVALRTGTSMDTATSAVIKLNKALIEARKDPDSDAGRAVKNLGLDIKALMALSPVERLQAVGRALNGFGGENKLEYNLALLGKSVEAMAPLLKDLAEAGKLQAKVTTEQADEAEKLRKEWAALSKETLDLSRMLVGPLVSSLNTTIDKIKEAKGFWATLRAIDQAASADIRPMLGLAGGEDLDSMRKQLEGLEGALSNVQLPPQMRVEYQQRRLQLAEQIAAAEKKATDGFLRGDKDTSPVPLPSLPDLGGNKTDTKALAAAKRAFEERRKLGEFAAEQELKLQEITAQETVEAWSYVNKRVIEQYEDRAAARKLQDEQVRESIDQQRQRDIDEGQAYLNALGDTGKKVGEEIGLVFSSAAGEALTQWKGVSNLLQGILADLAQIAVREAITKPLSGFVTDSLPGSIAKLLNIPSYDVGTPYVPQDMLAVVHRGERITPAAQNKPGGGATTIINNNVAAGVTRGEMISALQLAMRSTEASILGKLDRSRAFS